MLAKDKTNGFLTAQNMEFVTEAFSLGGLFTSAANASHKIKGALQVPIGEHVAMTLELSYPGVKFLLSVQHKN